jgi:diguanylate cyclase (GGDEF)-like protein
MVAVVVVGIFNLTLGFAVAVVGDMDFVRGLLGLNVRTDIPLSRTVSVKTSPTEAVVAPVLLSNDWKETLARLNVAAEDLAEASWWVSLDLIEKQRRESAELLHHAAENEANLFGNWQELRADGKTKLGRIVDVLTRARLDGKPHTDRLVTYLNTYIDAPPDDGSEAPADDVNNDDVNNDDVVDDGDAGQSDSTDIQVADGLVTGVADSPTMDETLIQIHDDIDALHQLREEMFEWLSQDSIEKSKFDNIPGKLRIDFATKLYNRAGLEYVIQQYSADTKGEATACLMLCNVDQCRQLNETVGIADADRILQTLARELDGSIRKERGFDRVARLGGQTLAIFLGYTDDAGAERFAERWRLRVETTTFKHGTQATQLTLRAAVINFDFTSTVADNIVRAQNGITAAKQDGGNLSKRVGETIETIETIETDEATPETRDVLIETDENSVVGTMIPLE